MADFRPTVVHVITRLDLGGAQENTLDTCRLLDRARFRVALLAGPEGRLDSAAARIPDLDFRLVPDLVREIEPRRDLAALRRLRDHLLELGQDGAPLIVHTHSSKAGILGRLAARAARARFVVHTIHGFGHPALTRRWQKGLAILAERMVARRTSRFVAVSRADVEEGMRLGLFRATDVELIRSGFDVTAFAEPGVERWAARRALGVESDGPLIGMVACLKPQKDPLAFLRAARLVLNERDDARFLMVGDGELRMEVEALRDRLGLGSALLLLGWREDVPSILRALDLFVLTSRWEGLPRALVQAMAAGVPVVACAAGGIGEVVSDGLTGRLVAPRDHRALAACMRELLEDRTRAARLAAAARERVASEFDVRLMIERLERLYQRLLAG
ncbi:MAG: glycosyltransferase [Planctomycetes bacterium]|nr:glycosyltransferase [Planctomycetota bacterium]